MVYIPDDVWQNVVLPYLLLPEDEFQYQKRLHRFRAEYHEDPEFLHVWKLFDSEQLCKHAHEEETIEWSDWVGAPTPHCVAGSWGFLVGQIPDWIPPDVRAAVRFETPAVFPVPVPTQEARELRKRAFRTDLQQRLTYLLQLQYASACFSPIPVRKWFIGILNDCCNCVF